MCNMKLLLASILAFGILCFQLYDAYIVSTQIRQHALDYKQPVKRKKV